MEEFGCKFTILFFKETDIYQYTNNCILSVCSNHQYRLEFYFDSEFLMELNQTILFFEKLPNTLHRLLIQPFRDTIAVQQ